MSGPIEIKSPSEWQSLLSGTTVVVADCVYNFPLYHEARSGLSANS